MKKKGTTMDNESSTATLTVNGQEHELPMYSPSAGPDVIDIRKLYAQLVFSLMTQGLLQQQAATVQSPILMAPKASYCIGVILSTN